MSDRELYQSFGLQAVDAKGRVAVPASLRSALEKNSESRSLWINRQRDLNCIIAYDAGWPQLLYKRIDDSDRPEYGATAIKDYNKVGTAFGNSEPAVYDTAGRFILPSYYRKKVGITDWAFFHGAGDIFTIWAPEVLLASTTIDEDTRDILEHLMAEKAEKKAQS